MAGRIGIIAFLLCFCLHFMPCPTQAASTSDASEPISIEKTCDLTLSYSSNGKTFPEMPVKLYKIADVSADYQYTLTPLFAASGLILNGIQTIGEWNVVRTTLEAHILAHSIAPDHTAVTDQAGQVCFEALTPGLYLATTKQITQDNWAYAFDSALVALPGLGDDGLWQYQVAVATKSAILPPDDTGSEAEYKVTKLWKNDKQGAHRPQSVTVEIFRNGESYQTVTLSEENHWAYTWKAKESSATWNVVERNIPSGYTVTAEKRGTSFILTNTFTEKQDTTTPPQSGDTTNVLLYVLLLNISGIVLVILGIAGKRKRL